MDCFEKLSQSFKDISRDLLIAASHSFKKKYEKSSNNGKGEANNHNPNKIYYEVFGLDFLID